MRVELKNFLVPTQPQVTHRAVVEPKISAVVPTYKPGATALRLVKDLLAYNPKMAVVVVDDSTPLECAQSMALLAQMRGLPRVTVLRTAHNRLKAGALNVGLSHVLSHKGPETPAVVVTLDDDVVIQPDTVAVLARTLMQEPELGAVCSRCSVLNKNANLLTRLQGLEYVGFNAIRLADQGFMRGPLVMHGMLTAFRTRALRQAGPFAERHLIEDYEMTTRIKTHGWRVRVVLEAHAATEVPETLRQFWRQRTRWSLGGVQVVVGAPDKTIVLQDVLGHGIFMLTLGVILLLLFIDGGGTVPPVLVWSIIGLSLVQLAAWAALQLWLMRWYKERDAWDWVLRLLLIPELLYSNIMTVVLLGSYAYSLCALLLRPMRRWGGVWITLVNVTDSAFAKIGYSGAWGTRSK